MRKFVFTITAGRTGTAWLAELIRMNLPYRCVHEPLGIDDFGTRMPEIRVMRSFNERGFTPVVLQFWDNKFASLARETRYAETNHTLAKCGLVEAVATADLDAEITFIVLRRDPVDLCLSLLLRHDFSNATLIWQWYLHSSYARRIIEPAPYRALGDAGGLLWYVAEIEARQIYYRTLFSDRFTFIQAETSVVTKPDGAGELLAALNGRPLDTVTLPPRLNAGKRQGDAAVREKLVDLVAAVDQPIEDLVHRYIGMGRRLTALPNRAPRNREALSASL